MESLGTRVKAVSVRAGEGGGLCHHSQGTQSAELAAASVGEINISGLQTSSSEPPDMFLVFRLQG